MSLSCSCNDDWDGDGVGYYSPNDYTTFTGIRRKRCCSCHTLIDKGALCTEFQRFRYPLSEVEDKIYGEGEQVPLADWFMCEPCSDQFFNLEELGFCIQLGDSMIELLREYQDMRGRSAPNTSQ